MSPSISNSPLQPTFTPKPFVHLYNTTHLLQSLLHPLSPLCCHIGKCPGTIPSGLSCCSLPYGLPQKSVHKLHSFGIPNLHNTLSSVLKHRHWLPVTFSSLHHLVPQYLWPPPSWLSTPSQRLSSPHLAACLPSGLLAALELTSTTSLLHTGSGREPLHCNILGLDHTTEHDKC